MVIQGKEDGFYILISANKALLTQQPHWIQGWGTHREETGSLTRQPRWGQFILEIQEIKLEGNKK